MRQELDTDATAAVHDLASQQGASVFSVVTAAVAEALARFTGRDDLVLGTPAGRRDRPELRDMVGPLLTMVPIRLDLQDDPTFGELVHRARRTILGGLANAESLPQAAPGTGDDAGGRGWFNVIVTDLGEDLSTPHLPGLHTQLVEIPRVGAKYDLNVLVTQTPHHLRLDAEFDPTAVDAATVTRMLDLCAQIATAGSAAPHHLSSRLACAPFGDPGPVALGQPLLYPPTPDQSRASPRVAHAQQAHADNAG
ncbi:MAG: condensation domain-containing protein, partial [Propionibacteriaceae bacterium]|nr:condensation domain-containing protein [Propionibacteriaceae bacterium]